MWAFLGPDGVGEKKLNLRQACNVNCKTLTNQHRGQISSFRQRMSRP